MIVHSSTCQSSHRARPNGGLGRKGPGLAILAAMIFCLATASASQNAWAFPEPAIVSKAWQYDFSHGPPRPIAVYGIGGQVRWFWYITYKVVNHTGDERLFVPEVTIFDDRGHIFPAGRNVPAAAFHAIKNRIENPLLENPAEIIGRILQGPDHAKEGVAIWPATEDDIDHITIFFSGLSGETAVIDHAETGERVVLRKTLMIDYDLPGTGEHIQDQPVVHKGEKWVMR